jgi:hypothetical protein
MIKLNNNLLNEMGTRQAEKVNCLSNVVIFFVCDYMLFWSEQSACAARAAL